jgi:hypothetical protein
MKDAGEQIRNIETQEFKINPITGMLISDGHEYVDSPEARAQIIRANTIRKSLPPPKEDQVRLWRGNRPGEVGENPSFTSSLEGIALPFLDRYQGELTYLDIPKADLEKYIRNVGATSAEFILPADLVKNVSIVKDNLRPSPVIEKIISLENKIPMNNTNNPSGWNVVDVG